MPKLKTYSENQLSRLADKYRPGSVNFSEELNVTSLVRNIIEPARRHRCELCRQIFECHLCQIGEDHVLHHSKRTDDTNYLICETCIHEHQLWVAVCSLNRIDVDYSAGMGKDVKFYDHLTGKRIKDSKPEHVARRPNALNRPITLDGVTKTSLEWAESLGMSYFTLRYRMTHWSSIRSALTEPVGASGATRKVKA